MAELAELVWRKVKGEGVPLRLVHDEPFEYDVQRRVPDTEKAEEVLGFEATTTLEEMLDEVIPWIDAAIKLGTIEHDGRPRATTRGPRATSRNCWH